jgi:hypothetical protein
MSEKPKRLIFTVEDEDLAALEAIRRNRGLRSHAETLRVLIRQAASSGLPTPERQAAMKVAVQKAQRKVAPAPFKSRLKGEWKAP